MGRNSRALCALNFAALCAARHERPDGHEAPRPQVSREAMRDVRLDLQQVPARAELPLVAALGDEEPLAIP